MGAPVPSRKGQAPPVDPSGVVRSLFPLRAVEHTSPPMTLPVVPSVDDDDEVPEATWVELREAVLRLQTKKTALGPDGIPGRAWVLALKEALGPRLLRLFSACLEKGQFPKLWKTGKQVLIRKEERQADSPSAYRPIVLLDEVCKLF
jgi:hypothetical protein